MSEPPRKRTRTPTPDDRRFGRHVRSLRRARGLPQEVLAEVADLSADTIRRLEHGSFSPSHDTQRKLCKGLGIRVSTLFEGFELVERDVPREIADAVRSMSPQEQDKLLDLLHVLTRLIRGGSGKSEA